MRKLGAAALAATCLALATSAVAKDKYQPMPATADDLKGAGLTYVQRQGNPGFMMMRPANAAFALVGALAAISTSRDFWFDNELTDPTNEINQRLAQAIAGQYGMTPARGVTIAPTGTTSFKDIGAQAGGARYVLNVQSRA